MLQVPIITLAAEIQASHLVQLLLVITFLITNVVLTRNAYATAT